MKEINKTYIIDLNDCIWNITFKRKTKNQLSKIMNELNPSPKDLTQSINNLIQYKLVG